MIGGTDDMNVVSEWLVTSKDRRCGSRPAPLTYGQAIFFSAATAAGAFGGLLARGIIEMDGVGDKSGWAWIFILEGLMTLIIGTLRSPYINPVY